MSRRFLTPRAQHATRPPDVRFQTGPVVGGVEVLEGTATRCEVCSASINLLRTTTQHGSSLSWWERDGQCREHTPGRCREVRQRLAAQERETEQDQ